MRKCSHCGNRAGDGDGLIHAMTDAGGMVMCKSCYNIGSASTFKFRKKVEPSPEGVIAVEIQSVQNLWARMEKPDERE